MKKLLIITVLLISNQQFGQLKSVIIDSETKEKIPFVNIWVENESIGTTSNLNGEFELKINESKIIVFSAIGYETRRISSEVIKSVVKLNPIATKLDEVVITPKSQNLTLAIARFKKSKINSYFFCGTNPWMSARYFKYEGTYSKTPFLEKIRVLTNSNIKDSRFNVRLYRVSEKGSPEGYLFDKNIIGVAKKGKKITEVDLSVFNLEFPEEGFFVAIEWLIIDDNKYEYTSTGSSNDKDVFYEPAVGTITYETDENSWIFAQGKWRKVMNNMFGSTKNNKGSYSLTAIELTLSN